MARRKKKSARRVVGRGIKKRSRRPKPLKIAALIASAIQDLRESKGLTSKKIIGYISYTHSMPESRVKRQVKTALKRGVDYGILRKYKGQYFLPTNDELQRANRMAIRFAKLATPPSSVETSSISTRRKPMAIPRASSKTSRRNSLPTSKRLAAIHSLPFSTIDFAENTNADNISVASGFSSANI